MSYAQVQVQVQVQVEGEGGEKVLLLGDQHEYIRKLRSELERYGYGTTTLPSLEAGFAVIWNRTLACVWVARAGALRRESLHELRVSAPRIPLIVILSGASEEERCSWLGSEADQCLDANMSSREAAAVTDAQIRQSERSHSLRFGSGQFRLGKEDHVLWRLDVRPPRSVKFSAREFVFFELHAERLGDTIPYKEIHHHVFGEDAVFDKEAICGWGHRVRNRLESVGGLHLVTDHGVGYRLVVRHTERGRFANDMGESSVHGGRIEMPR